jgi:RNA polymerase sigma-70 factor (ECF subfamily)
MALLQPIHSQAVATSRRLCRSPSDGDDLYHEAVLRAFDTLHGLRDESRFRSWFFAVLLSRHRSSTRRALWKRLLPWDDAFSGNAEPIGEDGADWEARGGSAVRAARALASLPAEQREAVVLFELDGFSLEEVARMQRTSLPAVKSRLARGRQRLRRWYERHGFATVARETERARTTRLSFRRLATATGEERGDE